MKKIYREEDINIDIQTIFNLVNDIESYPSYLPWCTSTKVLKESDNVVIGKINISKSFIKWDFSTKNTIVKNRSISLEFVDGPFENLDGEWLFTSLDDHNTKVSLEINYKFKSSLIELSIEPIFTSIMNSILKSFVQQAFKSKYDN